MNNEPHPVLNSDRILKKFAEKPDSIDIDMDRFSPGEDESTIKDIINQLSYRTNNYDFSKWRDFINSEDESGTLESAVANDLLPRDLLEMRQTLNYLNTKYNNIFQNTATNSEKKSSNFQVALTIVLKDIMDEITECLKDVNFSAFTFSEKVPPVLSDLRSHLDSAQKTLSILSNLEQGTHFDTVNLLPANELIDKQIKRILETIADQLNVIHKIQIGELNPIGIPGIEERESTIQRQRAMYGYYTVLKNIILKPITEG